MQLVICNNNKENFLWEPKNFENTGKILRISCVRCHFVKFDIYFLGLSSEIFFGVTTDELLHL